MKVIDQKPQYLEMAGNLIPVAKTEEQLNIVFRAFTENRLAFLVRIRDPTREPTARLTFMRERRELRGQTPVCSVVVTLPEFTPADSATDDQRTKTCQSLAAHFLPALATTTTTRCSQRRQTLPPGAATWRTRLNIRVVFDSCVV